MSLNDDLAYAMTPLKLLTLPLGVWPLQKYDIFSLVRCIVCIFSLVRFHLTKRNKITVSLTLFHSYSTYKFDSNLSEMLDSASWTEWK